MLVYACKDWDDYQNLMYTMRNYEREVMWPELSST